jgi:hypothetical protein
MFIHRFTLCTRQGVFEVSTIEVVFLYNRCGRVALIAGHTAKLLVHKCINGLSSNLVEGKQKQLAAFIYGLVDTNAIIFIVSSNQQKDYPTYSNL